MNSVNPFWIAGNVVAIISGLICMSYLIWVRRKLGPTPFPLFTIILIGLTVTITSLQFIYPELLALFRRNPDGLRAGEVWRLVTPMFVQPGGIAQCIANSFLLLGFMPMAEKVYGSKKMLVIFFGASLLAQPFLYAWLPDGGGSSSAALSLAGALFSYLLRERKQALLPFVILPVVGLGAAVVLAFFHDGHGAGILIGAAVAAVLPVNKIKFEN